MSKYLFIFSSLFLALGIHSGCSQTIITFPVADGFDFPVGPPNARKYYNANPFGTDLHLGDDWNGVGGGNTDFGDPVYSIGIGIVSVAEDFGPGWGNVVRVLHNIGTFDQPQLIESLYAHLDKMHVAVGDTLQRGQQLGTIGDAHGAYYAHLHLEIRSKAGMPLGGGYSENTAGYLDPTKFIKARRP
ncbi:MAG: M23 family metallopeptidase [Bacteroidetes bacterium]|nr:M23 family metallopeptidase [Bacteroidota bacterium]MCB0842974.1 M23 family metallopeptidase [Bacteroidota bacterium]